MADLDVANPADSGTISAYPSNARAMRAAALALFAGDAFGGGNMGGSANAHTLTVANTGLTLTDGGFFWGVAAATNTSSCTLQINSLTAKSIWLPNGSSISSSHAGAITIANLCVFHYHAADDAFYLLNPRGYMDQDLYDLLFPVGYSMRRADTTSPSVPYGVSATWTRRTQEAFLRIEGGTPTTGGGDTATTSSTVLTTSQIPAHTHTIRANVRAIDGATSEGDATIDTGSGLASGYVGSTGGGAGHDHTITAADLRWRSYAVWDRTA